VSCEYAECRLHKSGAQCVVERSGRMCDIGRFATSMVRDFGTFGQWVVREGAAKGGLMPVYATLKGSRGRVEVWGGDHHMCEVWVVWRDRSEEWVYSEGCGMTLRQGIERACELAGVQTRMEMRA
jgi:hypothetical protein